MGEAIQTKEHKGVGSINI